jgi:uncharacterized protein
MLVVAGLVGGIGITAIGPGGVLPTIGLFALTGLSPAGVAGTAIVTHVATGTLGAAAYTRSGQLRDRNTRRVALTLAAVAAVGTPVGVMLSTVVSRHAFAVVLAGVVAVAAGLVRYRSRRPRGVLADPSATLVVAIGLAVSAASGVVGIGGPMLAVPLLVAIGLPMLQSLACAQVQSIVIATVGTFGYLVHGTIDWPLAAVVGIPELSGVLVGWRIAHRLPTDTLRTGLVSTLCALAVYLIVHG